MWQETAAAAAKEIMSCAMSLPTAVSLSRTGLHGVLPLAFIG